MIAYDEARWYNLKGSDPSGMSETDVMIVPGGMVLCRTSANIDSETVSQSMVFVPTQSVQAARLWIGRARGEADDVSGEPA